MRRPSIHPITTPAAKAGFRLSSRSEEHTVMARPRIARPHRTARLVVTRVATAVLVASQLIGPGVRAASTPTAAEPAPVPAATTNAITLSVFSARTEPNWDGDPANVDQPTGTTGIAQGATVKAYKWMIVEDNTGRTNVRDAEPGGPCSPWADTGMTIANPDYPDSCTWASVAGLAPDAPVVAQGDETDLSGATSLNLPDGRYLISVVADNFKLDGTPFTIPMDEPGTVSVPLQPTPLPTATLRAEVFADVTSANGQYDPGEDGLPGFAGFLTDYLGQVTTDVFGNPLCTTYLRGSGPNGYEWADGAPVVDHIGGKCLSGDANMDGVVDAADQALYSDPQVDPGMLVIPNLGPNRYAMSAVPPTGSSWVQTTTLEGNHDWDAWVMEGSTGFDTEFIVNGEPFPPVVFGYVPGPSTAYWTQPGHHLAAGGTGSIKGVIDAVQIYVPTNGGLGLPGAIAGGAQGERIDGPIDRTWITLTDLNAGDTAVWVGRACPVTSPAPPECLLPGRGPGSFLIPNVPDGSYSITWWDEPQNYILDLMNVDVVNGQVVDLGVLPLTGWWAKLSGHVFNDLNRNGKRDPGEPGVPDFTLTMRKRENSLMDRGATLVTTNSSGEWEMVNAYPMTEWLVLEAYNDRYYTTGVTYQADNQPTPTTVMGQGVDVSVLPIIGLSGTIDWGVHAYDPTGANGIDPQNGGIVGSVSYDTTRNELDPQYAAAEDWQPGVPDLTVDLYAPVDCPSDGSLPCDARGDYALAPDGSYLQGKLLNTYVSERWERPTNCIARDVNGDPLQNPRDQQVLPVDPTDKGCIEAPLMGIQFGTYATDQGTPDANFGAAVNGNYGFGDGCFDGTLDATDPANPVCVGGEFTPLDAGDYLVHVNNRNDSQGKPIYQFTREEDINIGNGDSFVPQVPPPACVGALHTVDVEGDATGNDNYPSQTVTDPSGLGTATITVPASTPTHNPTFVDIGGSPYEGQARPLCDTKLVTLQNGKSVVPMFNVFTDVALPGRFFGLTINNLDVSTNPKSTALGEAKPIPFNPVGIYDFANRLITTVETDYNGIYDVLLPSTDRINCPTPSGVCANLYRFVGNDPGTPGRLNLNYNPAFRTIAAEFEALPGLFVPADTAPEPVGVAFQTPGSQTETLVTCPVNDPASAPVTPELYAVSKPYADLRDSTGRSFTIDGRGFGTATGTVALDGLALPTSAWSDARITASIPNDAAIGAHQLSVTAANGRSTVNGLTFHVLGFDPFPSTGVLDNFNRSGIGSNWNASSAFSLGNNEVRVTGTGWMRWGGSAGGGPVYGANQEAYITLTKVSPTATEQGVYLKLTGGNSPNPDSNNAAYVEASYNAATATVEVRTKRANTSTVVTQATFTGATATFVAGDVFGARALADGTVIAYRNGTEVGHVNVVTNPAVTAGNRWPAGNAAGGGRIGVRYAGAQNNTTNDARFDNFGAGNATGYVPQVLEVGPGKAYEPADTLPATADHAIQQALDDATSGALVVVYPNNPSANPRVNPRGAYYENLIISKAVKLQGVGPGSPDGSIRGSIIDGGAFGGDGPVVTDWYTTIGGLTWDGNQDVYDGADISLYLPSDAFPTTYDSRTAPSIDGFDLRGGDQQGFPGNPLELGVQAVAGPLVTQGGAIYANGYARNLQVSNNVVQNNGGAYGTIRIGTPNLPAPLTNNHNEGVRITHNRVIANGGTNLAGGIGLFAGSDGYVVSGNDLCGNFSSEYGGGMTVYGYSPNGSIDHNRIYLNRSFDEGGGIMIAGELPTDPSIPSPGSGPVAIHDNVIQSNLANDDGGGIRFLMAGNFPMDVYNNVIANNVSTHEGGGIALDDAPDVRIFENTIMKNLTTATAITSNGAPAPAGLSTGANSDLLQATLPSGAPTFSNPLLFDNIFWDNRAGTRGTTSVTGIGAPGDATPIDHWDIGVPDGSGLLAPTNSLVQQAAGTHPYTTSATNLAGDPAVVKAFDTQLTFAAIRTNPNFIGAILVTQVALDVPPDVIGDYHLTGASPAKDAGAASKSGVNAPSHDIDGDLRPSFNGFDIGADEIPARANFAIANTDGVTSVFAGDPLTYTITVSNGGPDPASGTVTDSFPAALTVSGWSCSASAGSTCSTAGTGNARTGSVTLLAGGSATFTAQATVGPSARGSIVNTASVSAVGAQDPNLANNTATDTDTITVHTADLSITKTDGSTAAWAGDQVTYTIVAGNAGPDPAAGASITDTLPSGLTGATWTCTAAGGASCGAAGGSGSLASTADLPVGGTATYTVTGTVSAGASGTLANSAAVAVPSSMDDPDTANNSATDSDGVIGVLDNFNRGSSNNLGSSWAQRTTTCNGGGSRREIQVSSDQAWACASGQALWTSSFGAVQAAGYTFAQSGGSPASPLSGSALILKASGSSSSTSPSSFIRVAYTGTQVLVQTTTNGGSSFTTTGTYAATFATNDKLRAVAYSNGSVSVWRVSGGVVTLLGSSSTSSFTGTGRIGIQLPAGQRIDDFSGGTLP